MSTFDKVVKNDNDRQPQGTGESPAAFTLSNFLNTAGGIGLNVNEKANTIRERLQEQVDSRLKAGVPGAGTWMVTTILENVAIPSVLISAKIGNISYAYSIIISQDPNIPADRTKDYGGVEYIQHYFASDVYQKSFIDEVKSRLAASQQANRAVSVTAFVVYPDFEVSETSIHNLFGMAVTTILQAAYRNEGTDLMGDIVYPTRDAGKEKILNIEALDVSGPSIDGTLNRADWNVRLRSSDVDNKDINATSDKLLANVKGYIDLTPTDVTPEKLQRLGNIPMMYPGGIGLMPTAVITDLSPDSVPSNLEWAITAINSASMIGYNDNWRYLLTGHANNKVERDIGYLSTIAYSPILAMHNTGLMYTKDIQTASDEKSRAFIEDIVERDLSIAIDINPLDASYPHVSSFLHAAYQGPVKTMAEAIAEGSSVYPILEACGNLFDGDGIDFMAEWAKVNGGDFNPVGRVFHLPKGTFTSPINGRTCDLRELDTIYLAGRGNGLQEGTPLADIFRARYMVQDQRPNPYALSQQIKVIKELVSDVKVENRTHRVFVRASFIRLLQDLSSKVGFTFRPENLRNEIHRNVMSFGTMNDFGFAQGAGFNVNHGDQAAGPNFGAAGQPYTFGRFNN